MEWIVCNHDTIGYYIPWPIPHPNNEEHSSFLAAQCLPLQHIEIVWLSAPPASLVSHEGLNYGVEREHSPKELNQDSSLLPLLLKGVDDSTVVHCSS